MVRGSMRASIIDERVFFPDVYALTLPAGWVRTPYGMLTLASDGSAVFPILPTHGAASITTTLECWSPPATETHARPALLMFARYYGADGNPVANSQGHTFNSGARALTAVEAWQDQSIPFTLGPNVKAVTLNLQLSTSWGVPGMQVRNGRITLTH